MGAGARLAAAFRRERDDMASPFSPSVVERLKIAQIEYNNAARTRKGLAKAKKVIEKA